MATQIGAHNRLRHRPQVSEADAYRLNWRPEGPTVSRPGREAGNAIAENTSAKGTALTGAIVPRLQRSMLDDAATRERGRPARKTLGFPAFRRGARDARGPRKERHYYLRQWIISSNVSGHQV